MQNENQIQSNASAATTAQRDRRHLQLLCADCRINHDIMIECADALADFAEEERNYAEYLAKHGGNDEAAEVRAFSFGI